MGDIHEGRLLTRKSAFYVASISKQFTAACIVILAQSGELTLDDDIRKYVPSLPNYGSLISIRHLAYHTSGLRDDIDLWRLAGRSWKDPFSNDDLIGLLTQQRALNFRPGEKQLYSNTGYLLMAEIVEVVSGTSLAEFARTNIFDPLGMRDSLLDDGSVAVRDRVVSYEADASGGYRPYAKRFTATGSGGMITTVEDLFLWDQNCYHDRLGAGDVMSVLETRGSTNDGRESNYAFGLHHGYYKGLRTVSSSGMMLGFRGRTVRFPEHRFTIICLGNGSGNGGTIPDRGADIYLSDSFTWGDLAGDYHSSELGAAYSVAFDS